MCGDRSHKRPLPIPMCRTHPLEALSVLIRPTFTDGTSANITFETMSAPLALKGVEPFSWGIEPLLNIASCNRTHTQCRHWRSLQDLNLYTVSHDLRLAIWPLTDSSKATCSTPFHACSGASLHATLSRRPLQCDF